ncbi:MAG: acetylxylan esterase [Candidatus Solibacter sp.]|jgi:dienelactone hydrolase
MSSTRRVPGWVVQSLVSLVITVVPRSAPAAVPESDIRNIETADYKTHFKMPDYTSRKQWEDRRTSLRQQILSAAGLLPMPLKTPLHAKIIRRLAYRDYTIETVLIETLPGYFLGGNLYRPTGETAPAPAVLLPHGHWKRGRLEDQPSYSVPALGINLARQGYVVFAYDMVGFNDTQQTPHSFGGWLEDLWSFHPMGLQLWNSIRALDYLQSLPDVDARRIAATGASGGGTQTFLLAAVDERVRYVAPVNMVSAHMQGGDPCEEAPNLRLDTFNVEIAAMIAPRPMLLVSSTHDWTSRTPIEEFPAIRHIYELYGAGDRVQNAHIDAEHNYNRQSRESVYHFLAKNMWGAHPPASLVDHEVSPPEDQDLLAFPKVGARDLEGYADVFQMWKITATLQTQSNSDPAAQREALRYALAAEWPPPPEAVMEGNRIILTRIGKGDRVTGYWRPGKGAGVLVVHPGGSNAALRTDVVEKLMQSGRPVLIVEPFISNAARVRKQRFDDYFLSYNQTDSAERVQDILTGLAFLKDQSGGRPELIGVGDGGIWCVFAAAVAPIAIDVIADLNGFGGSDEDFRNRFFVPGIQRAGGLSGALKLVNTARGIIPAQVSTPVTTGAEDQ